VHGPLLERLGSPDIDARLGGIHVLAHVANGSGPLTTMSSSRS
jgi:hypothetical protein